MRWVRKRDNGKGGCGKFLLRIVCQHHIPFLNIIWYPNRVMFVKIILPFCFPLGVVLEKSMGKSGAEFSFLFVRFSGICCEFNTNYFPV